jgi:hypothetical protein
MKKAVLLDVASCGFIINRRFGGNCRPHLQSRKINANDVTLFFAHSLLFSSKSLTPLLVHLFHTSLSAHTSLDSFHGCNTMSVSSYRQMCLHACI